MDIKGAANNAVDAVTDTAKKAANAVSEGASSAAQFVKDKTGIGADGIREHMDVYASCGTKVAVVDHVRGNTLMLTKNSSDDGMHHYLPLSAVAKVDSSVHLNMDHVAFMAARKDSEEACAV